MNYRMIIADDEEMLIRLIKKLGRFEALGIEIVDECHDGEEAYRSILEHRPDFVLTDIQMPLLDGLEMIERVQPAVPDTLFVLISGYRYFEYARTAIQLSAVDYLLKPVNGEQLNLLLERLCRLTDERRRQRQDSQSLKSFQDSASQEQSNALWKLLLGEAPGASLDAEGVRERCGIAFRHPRFRVLALDYYLAQVSGMGRLSFVDKLNEAARAAFDGRVDHWIHEMDGRYMVLFNFAEADAAALSKAVSTFFYNCKEFHEVFGAFRMTLGLSDIARAASELPGAVGEALDAAWGWLFFSGDQIIRFDQVKDMPRLDVEAALPEPARRRLLEGVQYLREDDVDGVFGAIERQLRAAPYLYPGDLRRLCLRARQAVVDGAAGARRAEIASACDDAVKAAWEPVQALGGIAQAAKRYIREQQAAVEQAGQSPVRRAQAYIRQNYAGDISLDSVARAVGISASYLSRVFKEISGTGFNDYLTAIRLEESKRLLSDTNLSIHDVAARVGYFDEKYYSKLFKKTFGIKPTEYRRLYG